MKLVPVHNAEKIEAMAQTISNFIAQQFANVNYDSAMQTELSKLPEQKYATNSEYWLAMCAGLSLAKDKAFAEFLKLMEEAEEDEDDEDD